ncbi:MAG: hypothetical protein ACKVQS_08405 [Fimbriimonadaceae bacterium]
MEHEPILDRELGRQLTEALRANNDLLERQLKLGVNWRIHIRNGLIQGFSFAVGASILVSGLIWALKPLRGIEGLREPIEQLSQELQRRGR